MLWVSLPANQARTRANFNPMPPQKSTVTHQNPNSSTLTHTMKISKTTSLISLALISIVLTACGGSSTADGAVSGTLSGLNAGASLALQNNGADTITVTSNGTFVFPTKIAALGAFSVSIATQPVGQICAVSRATGVIPTDGNQANVTTVVCVSNTLGVNVSGLASGKTVTVGNAGVQIVVNTNGVSTFSGVLTGGTSYALTVDSQPAGQVCTLSNASGTTATGAQSLATLTCI